MKIAVIGATGMIGHHTAKAVLEKGHELVILRRKTSNLKRISDLNYIDRIIDFNNSSSIAGGLQDIDAVIHCGAYYPTEPRHWKEEVIVANNQMEIFYDACKMVPLKKIVYLGAAIALPKSLDGEPGTEELIYESRPENKTPYLQVKYELDWLAREKAKKGLPVVIAIPSMCFGEYDYGPSTGRLVVEIAKESMPAYIEGNRNVIYAGDAGKGIVLAAEKGRAGERYLFTGTNISMSDLTRNIAVSAGVKPPSKRIPLPIAKLLAFLFETKQKLTGGKEAKLNSTTVAIMALGQFLEGEKSETELGFTSTLSLDETIERTIQWFREEGYIPDR